MLIQQFRNIIGHFQRPKRFLSIMGECYKQVFTENNLVVTQEILALNQLVQQVSLSALFIFRKNRCVEKKSYWRYHSSSRSICGSSLAGIDPLCFRKIASFSSSVNSGLGDGSFFKTIISTSCSRYEGGMGNTNVSLVTRWTNRSGSISLVF